MLLVVGGVGCIWKNSTISLPAFTTNWFNEFEKDIGVLVPSTVTFPNCVPVVLLLRSTTVDFTLKLIWVEVRFVKAITGNCVVADLKEYWRSGSEVEFLVVTPVEFIDNDSKVNGLALPLMVMFAFVVPKVALPPIITVP